MRRWSVSGFVVLVTLSAACGSSNAPTAPSSPAGLTGQEVPDSASAEPNLKATTPMIVQPKDRVRVDTLTPTLEWQNARGKYRDVPFTYEVELYEGNTFLRAYTLPQDSSGRTTLAISDALKYDTLYRWRVRAQYGNGLSAWDVTADFFTPMPPFVPSQPSTPGQAYGATRNISINEAYSIIRNYHDRSGANLGSGSTRESRVAFFWAAVAIVHFGHPDYNSSGGDRNWCVKDAGSGRPPSDDVIVACSTRDAWDLVGGAGANGYSFHIDYLGKLPSDQNVYPPPISSLPAAR